MIDDVGRVGVPGYFQIAVLTILIWALICHELILSVEMEPCLLQNFGRAAVAARKSQRGAAHGKLIGFRARCIDVLIARAGIGIV
jgi:hypothetical protein